MGLVANLRVLCGSDIGDQVAQLRSELRKLRNDVDDHMDTIERRTRRWQKRERDDVRAAAAAPPVPGLPPSTGNARLDALARRRATLGRIGADGQ